MKKFIEQKKKGGFTLIEILVAVALFSFIIAAASGLFISALRVQKKSLASQELFNQTSFLMEYMSRALRMAKKELSSSPTCLSQAGLNYEIAEVVPGQIGLKFINYEGVCQGFFLQNYQLKEWKEGYPVPLVLTSANLDISDFNISLSGRNQDDNLQPAVTLFLKIKVISQQSVGFPEINIQTTVSQRNLDVQYAPL